MIVLTGVDFVDDIRLTSRGRKLLSVLYEEYGKQLKAGKTEMDAVLMGSPDEIQETLLPDWRREKVVSACSDLADAGFLNLIEGDNDVLGAILTNAAIAWMDAQGSRRAQTVWSIIKTVFSFLR
jgi:hypothetical protein